MKPKIVPLGDAALLVQLGDEIDLALNRRVHALDALLNHSPIRGFIETVPAYGTVLIHYDPLTVTYAAVRQWVRETLAQVTDLSPAKPRRIEVPVKYGGEYGPDLETVAQHCNMSIEDVIRIHSGEIYTVFMMGFTPGFPYMGRLDERIIMPRLEAPRTRVPQGTVAIAGAQTGVYPLESPGGWRLIGHTSLQLFDPQHESPFLFAPGDEVKFYEIS